MKSAYLLAGIQFRIFLQLVRNNKVSLWPKYIFRFLFVLQNSVWASLFAWREKQKYGKQIAAYIMPNDPVFIIGHWRTGSTYLHQLMNLDENLSAPSLFQTAQPNGFKVSYRYFRPLMKMVLGKTRPFDQIKNSMDEPQEDEFGLVRLTVLDLVERAGFAQKPPPPPFFFFFFFSIFISGRKYLYETLNPLGCAV